MLKFSIVCATYNRCETISRALSSLRQQTYPLVELIVVDGLSEDDTASVAKRFLKPGDILISEKDNGIYDALNKGLLFATGDVIGFLHSDDYYPNPYILETVAEEFKKSQCQIVYGNAEFFSKANHKKIVRKYKSVEINARNLSSGRMPAHPAIFCKKDLYSTVGLFDSKFEIAADYEWLCRLVQKSSIRTTYLDSSLIQMQMGGASRIGFCNTLKLNLEVYRAIRSNGLQVNILKIISKYYSKSLEFFN